MTSRTEKQERFQIILHEGSLTSPTRTVFVDRQTGVEYLLIRAGYGAAITILVDADGKPLIAPGFDQ